MSDAVQDVKESGMAKVERGAEAVGSALATGGRWAEAHWQFAVGLLVGLAVGGVIGYLVGAI
jgi:hypothetical protein